MKVSIHFEAVIVVIGGQIRQHFKYVTWLFLSSYSTMKFAYAAFTCGSISNVGKSFIQFQCVH